MKRKVQLVDPEHTIIGGFVGSDLTMEEADAGERCPERASGEAKVRAEGERSDENSAANNDRNAVVAMNENCISSAVTTGQAEGLQSIEIFSHQVRIQQQANEHIQAEVNNEAIPGEEDNLALKSKERSATMILKAWLVITRRVLPSSMWVFVFMWVFYIPALILPVNMLCAVSPVLYVHVREIFARSLNIFAYAVITRETFGYELSKNTVNAYCPVVLVFYLMHYTLECIFQFTIPIFDSLLLLIIIYSMIYHVYYTFKKENKEPKFNEKLEKVKQFCIKSGKLIVVCLVVFVSFQVIIPLFTSSNFVGKIIIRFIIFPTATFLTNNYQLIVAGGNISSYKKYLVPITYIRYLLQYTSRSMLISISHNPLSFFYILFCFGASVAQIINRITIKQQQIMSRILFDRLIAKLNTFLELLPFGSSTKLRQVSVVPSMEYPFGVGHDSALQNVRGSNTTFNKDFREIRAIHIIEGVKIDIQTMISTPVLFYFVHRLFEDKGITLMKSPTEVILQITVQLLFEIGTNSLLFFYEHHYLHLPILHELDKEGYISHAFRFICQICALFYLHYIFYSFY